MKNILTDGRQIEFISSQKEYYEEVYNLRRGLYNLQFSSLANLTNITSMEMEFLSDSSRGQNLTYILGMGSRILQKLRLKPRLPFTAPYKNDEDFVEGIQTTDGVVYLDLQLHAMCKIKFSMVLTHLDNQRDGVLDVYHVDYTVLIDNSDHSGLAMFSINQFLHTG